MIKSFFLFILLIKSSTSFDWITNSSGLQVWTKIKTNSDEIDEEGSIFLGRDEQSGCLCRKSFDNSWTVCFGRENCAEIPRNIKITTKSLRIKGSKIYEVKRGDFDTFHNLTKLELDNNYNLNRIQSGSFINMTQLQILSISSNSNLMALQKDSFLGLTNLEELYLIKNGFTSLRSLTLGLNPKSLPKLSVLDLSQNFFTNIKQDDFKPMLNSSLKELKLILCRIETIHPDALSSLKSLKVLRLGENTFNISNFTQFLNKTIESKIPLKVLNLYSIGLRKNPPEELLQVIADSNIMKLILSRNQFEILSQSSFPYLMNNLEILDLSEVSALNISDDTFTKLPNLKVLILKSNKLSSLPDGVLLEQLTYLDLQDNSNSGTSSSYFSLYGRKFRNMKNLQTLDLSYNRINAIYNTTFKGLDNLTTLGLRNASIYYISPNSFTFLTRLLFLNLENNHFNRRNINPEIFTGLERLEVLLLGGCNLNYIENGARNLFRFVPNLKHLGLERNKFVMIEAEDFVTVPLLKSLDLSKNILQPWQNRVFNSNLALEELLISNNKISYLSGAMLNDFETLTRVDLSENPLICDCDSHKTYKSHESLIKRLFDDNSSVFCTFSEDVTNLTYLDYVKTGNGHHCSTIPVKLLLFLPLSLLLVLILIFSISIYYYRSHLRYWIFLTRLYLTRKNCNKNSKCSNKSRNCDYVYDAFVSYSNEDQNFVIRLVTMLENYHPFLKLCVYERDFQIGTMISDNVLESVSKSRRTLLIISNSYVKSQWCRWESQIAEHHRLFFQSNDGKYVDDSLVLIKLGPVNESNLTPTLRFLLKSRVYLQWDPDEKKQRIFWTKLRNALTPPQEINENTHL